MAETVETRIGPREAISRGFELFEEFFVDKVQDNTLLDNILLEGVEFVETDGEWKIVIGFDYGRKKETTSSLGFGQTTKEPIREKRSFFLKGKDGTFVRMEDE